MSTSQRIDHNYGLEYSIKLANDNKLPLIVFFGISPSYPDANRRHYYFMLEGINELRKNLNDLNIHFVTDIISPDKGVIKLLNNCSTLIMDYAYTKIHKKWAKSVIDESKILGVKTYTAESDLVVPISETSEKLEYSARTIRPKILSKYKMYLNDCLIKSVEKTLDNKNNYKSVETHDINEFLLKLNIDQSVRKTKYFKGGESQAKKVLDNFLNNSLDKYFESNDPSNDYSSKLSPYIHFGQISTVYIIKKVNDFYEKNKNRINIENVDSFIEQILVRRELAFNYIYYSDGYDDFYKMTDAWAYKTMRAHELDEREYIYSLNDFDNSKTHDKYWNAAMLEMKKTGYMHNYMRMYWGKKIIEWTPNYKQAYEIILYLNNKYFIDGRDANSYASVAWLFGKHDRAWTERKVFGKLRYMNEGGLKRKFNIEKYVERIIKT